ncbi:MAG: HAMP domain-containing histidine kinase [Roseburia sp.]|nr:HAMP domain-containing histidine kinase [Roseburia sp.]
MKSVPKLIRRFVSILMLSVILLIVLNLILLVIFAMGQSPNAHPWTTAEQVAEALRQTEAGEYVLSQELVLELAASDAWGILVDNGTGQVVWQTEGLPETVPLSYAISDIAGVTRGYIDGYPTFTAAAQNGLVVLGYPRDSFWKHMWPSWDYHTIANLPQIVCCGLLINVLLIFVIYAVANAKLLRSVRPIVNGIQALPKGDPVYIREKGLLSELAVNINKTSELLQTQNRQLRRKELARANWIAGVSHDIRTPLSVIMGYAGQLREDAALSEEARQRAAAIVKQSARMRDLINDLNLASKLEYNMQPIRPKRENLLAIVRQVAVDFMNTDTEDKYPMEWETQEGLSFCLVNADRDLMRRAVSNLLWNCIRHNEQGCTIYVRITAENNRCTVSVDDDGVGAADEQIEKLNHTPHYMVCDENTTEQRHGLGLLIVRQIIAAHGGTVTVGHGAHGGFGVTFTLPMLQSAIP